MASPKMLERRKADLERETLIRGRASYRISRRLMKEKGRVVVELVQAAASGDEGAQTLLTEMRKELVAQHTKEIK